MACVLAWAKTSRTNSRSSMQTSSACRKPRCRKDNST